MPKRTLTLVISLVLIAGGLVFLALSTLQPQQQLPNASISPTPIFAHTTLNLMPNPAISTAGANTQIAVMINSNGDKVSAAQLELAFDPTALTFVDIAPATTDAFFNRTTQLLKVIDQRNGKVSYAIALASSEKTKAGSGTLAVITVRLAPTAKQAELTFLPSTLVTATGVTQSVLTTATGTTITLGTPTTSSVVIPSPTIQIQQ